jgi:Flp pilus assembly protein TadG
MNTEIDLNPVTATTLPEEACLNSRHKGYKSRRKEAQVTVEFALICIPFFAILFATIDYAQIYFYENSLQNAMREAARFGTAGRVIQATYSDGSLAYDTNQGVIVPRAILDSHGNEASRNECIRYWFLSNCVFSIPLSNITISNAPTLPGVPPYTTTNSYGDVILLSGTNTPAIKGPGAANNYIQVTATLTVPTITPLMSYLGGYSHGGYYKYPVRVSAIVKNEPALLNFLHTNMYSYEP